MHRFSLLGRSVAEFTGTFLMTSIGLMTVATAITTGAYGLFELSIAFALTIMVIILVVGAISGSHVNPAITIALATYKRFPWREVPAYIVAQVLGGVVGSLVLYALYRAPILAFEAKHHIVRGTPASDITAMIFNCYAPNPAIAGANDWSSHFISTPAAFAGEAFGTFVLALTLFMLLENRNVFAPSPGVFALILGLVVGFIIMVLAPLTMSGINPARDLGPRIATWLLGWGSASFPGVGPSWWVWSAGPIVGAIAGGGAAIGLSRLIPGHPEASVEAAVDTPQITVDEPVADRTPAPAIS